jgi:hypothetical protein
MDGLIERMRANAAHRPVVELDVSELTAALSEPYGGGPRYHTLPLNNTAAEHLVANIQSAAARGLPMISADDCAGRPALIVGTGPSLNDPDVRARIRELAGAGAAVFATKGATAVLADMGILPDFAVSCDGQPSQVRKTPAVPGVRHLVASCCHPDLFDHILGFAAGVEVFHSACAADDEEALYRMLFPGPLWVAQGGATVINRALACAWLKGCTHFHVAGADFGVRGDDMPTDDTAYAAGSSGFDRPGDVWFNDGGNLDGRTWQTKPGLIRGAIHIAAGVREGHVTVIGDSVAAALARRPEPLDWFLHEIEEAG